MVNPEINSNNTEPSEENVLSEMPSFSEHLEEIEQSEQDPDKLERFQDLVMFFEKDASIKKLLVQLAPDEEELYSDGASDYSDRLYDGFRYINNNLSLIMSNLYHSDEIEARLKEIKDDIIDSSAAVSKLSEVYRRDFTSMSEDFNKKVLQESVAYSLFNNPHFLDGEAKSINEILHLIHSSIMNNEGLIHSLPILEQSENGYNFLYGTPSSKNDIAVGIFNGVKNDDYATDIVSVDGNRTMMMVRDRGHALTVDIRKDQEGKYLVEYFVPKICNIDKVNKLPGVRKVQKDSSRNQARDFTTGIFGIDSEDEVVGKVLEFIAAVPTDFDIERSY